MIEVSFREPAVTWLENTYLITMPVNGRIGRVPLIPGDRVAKGAELVAFDRVPLEQALAEAEASPTVTKPQHSRSRMPQSPETTPTPTAGEYRAGAP